MSNNPLPPGPSPNGMTSTEEVTARTQILALIHRYASLARGIPDARIQSEIASLFLPNATVLLPDGRGLSPREIGKITENNPPSLLRHHVTTVDVQFASVGEANCQTYIVAGTHLKMPDHWGRWDDIIVRNEEGRWLFKRKEVVVDGMDGEGWLAQTIALGGGAGEAVEK